MRLLLIIMCILASAGKAHCYDLLIRSVTLRDPSMNAEGTVTDVLIREGRIREVGQSLVVEGNVPIINARGQYLSPGLIDAHIHLYHATGLNRRVTANYRELFADYFEQMPRSYLYWGYTTVVELNADAHINARFLAEQTRPDLIHCGQGIVLPDGFMSLEYEPEQFFSYFPNYLSDPYGASQLPVDADPSEHTPQAVVDAVWESGGRCIKMYYEEALWWPGQTRPPFALPSAQIMAEVVQAAHARGIPVFLHATTPRGIEIGLEAGVDAFAHGPWEWPAVGFWETALDPVVERLMQATAESDSYLQPTVRTIQNTRSLFDDSVLEDQEWRHIVSGEVYDAIVEASTQQRDQFLQRFQTQLPGNTEGQTIFDLQTSFVERYLGLISRFHDQGGRFSFGTDTAVGGPGWGAPPGLAGFWEMRDWTQAGISPQQIHFAATFGNAGLLGIDDHVGRIAPGYQANLVLLSNDPWQSVDAWNSIDAVIVHGRIYERESLSALSTAP